MRKRIANREFPLNFSEKLVVGVTCCGILKTISGDIKGTEK
jgi:6-phosphofructokinase